METQWSQPFHWGLLMAGDAAGKWAEPALVGNDIVATSTSLAVPVLRAQDVDTPHDDGATPCAGQRDRRGGRSAAVRDGVPVPIDLRLADLALWRVLRDVGLDPDQPDPERGQ